MPEFTFRAQVGDIAKVGRMVGRVLTELLSRVTGIERSVGSA